VSPSEEISGLEESIDRLTKRTEEEKRRLEEREEILDLLRKANEEIQELKKSRVTRDEMAEFFDEFLNEFSHAVEDIKDPETKNAFRGLTKRTKDAFKKG
jgi:predicted RNA-binding protein with EMAP domain